MSEGGVRERRFAEARGGAHQCNAAGGNPRRNPGDVGCFWVSIIPLAVEHVAQGHFAAFVVVPPRHLPLQRKAIALPPSAGALPQLPPRSRRWQCPLCWEYWATYQLVQVPPTMHQQELLVGGLWTAKEAHCSHMMASLEENLM